MGCWKDDGTERREEDSYVGLVLDRVNFHFHGS